MHLDNFCNGSSKFLEDTKLRKAVCIQGSNIQRIKGVFIGCSSLHESCNSGSMENQWKFSWMNWLVFICTALRYLHWCMLFTCICTEERSYVCLGIMFTWFRESLLDNSRWNTMCILLWKEEFSILPLVIEVIQPTTRVHLESILWSTLKAILSFVLIVKILAITLTSNSVWAAHD